MLVDQVTVDGHRARALPGAIIQSNGQYELQKRVLGSFNNPSIFFAYRAIQKAHPV